MYEEPPVNHGEILRYLGAKGLMESLENGSLSEEQAESNRRTLMLVNECLSEVLPVLKYQVVYAELNDVEMREAGIFDLDYLKDARSLVIFGATVGLELDRLINKYSKVSVSKAAVIEAIGSERIEALCDSFNDDVDLMADDNGLITKHRISPGYGKFKLDSQKEMFRLLDLNRKGGITLNESLLMSPSKSVTAVIGIFDEYEDDPFDELNHCDTNKCASCTLGNCQFRDSGEK